MSAPTHRLKVSGGARTGETLDLVPGKVHIIGRAQQADMRFPEDPFMSRAHVELRPDGNGWLLKNNSQHGTLVSGAVIQGEKRLAPGEVIMAGGTLVLFELIDPSSANKPWPPAKEPTTAKPMARSAVLPVPAPTDAKAPAPAEPAKPASKPPEPAKAAEPAKAEPAKPAEAPKEPAKKPTGSVKVPDPAKFPQSPKDPLNPDFKPPPAEKRTLPHTPAFTDSDDSDISGALPVVFLPGDSKELSADELANFALFKGIPAKTIEGSIIKRHKINDQPPIWLRKYKPGEIICKEGDYGSTAYFITKGTVVIGINLPEPATQKGVVTKLLESLNLSSSSGIDDDDDVGERSGLIPIDAPVHLPYDKPVAELRQNDLFGEMSCMSFYPRSATCVAGNDGVEVLELLRSVLDFIRTQGKADYKERIEKNYRERTLDLALKNVPLFAGLPAAFVDVLKPHIEMVEFAPDTAICKMGDLADAFFLVRLGFVKVSQQRAGGEVVLQYLGPGQYFGEIGLIQGGKRTATCTAVDHVELIKIAKTDFDNLISKYPEVRSVIEKAAADRLGQQRKIAERPGEMPLALLAEKGVTNAQNCLVIDLDRCTRCDECVRACADQHGGITRLVRDGLRLDRFLIATACRACTDPVCMIGCPVGSIRRRNSLEILIEDWCIGCGKCAQQCPYGNITMHPFMKRQKVEKEENGQKVRRKELAVVNSGKGKAVTCDLCGGGMEPRCVYACPHDAAKRGHPLDLFSSTLPLAR